MTHNHNLAKNILDASFNNICQMLKWKCMVLGKYYYQAVVYAVIGLVQLIKRKSLLKVDKEIILLGIFYIVIIILYIFFKKYIINYCPILMNGFKESSYPSSHTLITICLCGSSIMINKILYNNKTTKYVNVFSLAIIIITVIGRLLSGVHWFTDILGGILISLALLMTFYSFLHKIYPK